MAAAGLFMAQAVVLFIYSQHLAQPRKALHERGSRANHGDTWSERPKTPLVLAQTKSRDTAIVTVKLYTCRACNTTGFESLAAVNAHKREGCPERVA